MQAVKYVFVAVFAVCALQGQAAEISRSADKVDLRLFVENGAAIAQNMFKAINTGLDQSKPNVDKMLNELAPEVKTILRKHLDEARRGLNEKEKSITHMFTSLTKALDTLKPIKGCYDKVAPAAKILALATEREALKIVTGVRQKFNKEITNILTGALKISKKVRTLFDTEVDAVVKCLTPGKKDATQCLNTELDKTLKGVSEISVSYIILLNTAKETLSPIAPELITKMLPLVDKVAKDGRVILKDLGDCVSKMK